MAAPIPDYDAALNALGRYAICEEVSSLLDADKITFPMFAAAMKEFAGIESFDGKHIDSVVASRLKEMRREAIALYNAIGRRKCL